MNLFIYGIELFAYGMLIISAITFIAYTIDKKEFGINRYTIKH